MRRGELKTGIINQALRGGNSKARIGNFVDENNQWWSIYLATDERTGRVRRTPQGNLKINIKPQKDFPQAELVDDPGEAGGVDDGAVWTE